ncbi:hypothetical protein UF06_12470 [Vibrio sp. S234-5]|nr:hypothetical protein UF06_12470 [Vibrio sp. S234-5]
MVAPPKEEHKITDRASGQIQPCVVQEMFMILHYSDINEVIKMVRDLSAINDIKDRLSTS